MKKPSAKSADKDMRAEYDFSRGVRGKYFRRYHRGANVVVLEPDRAKARREIPVCNAVTIDKKLLQAFEKFEALRRETSDDFVRNRVLRHANYILPENLNTVKSIVFKSMADDFTRGLIGEVNRFLVNIQHADCWVRVANDLGIDEKLGLLWEFADPFLELSVARPYSLRNQFIFAVVHLAHQANIRKKNWKDKLPPDKSIDYKTLAKVDGGWKSFSQFLKSLEQLNATAFKDQETRNFRHRLEHRFRLHFDTGITTFFERVEQDGRVTYSSKAIPPLQLGTLIPELYKQHEKSVDVFKAYWQLLNEICSELACSSS